MEQSKKKPITAERKLARTRYRKSKRRQVRKANRPEYAGAHPQALIDDLATTRKAGAKYFHDLGGRPDCTLDGSTKLQLKNFFRKKHPLSREELQPNALAEVEKWESMAPVEGSAEFDKATVRLLRDYLVEGKLGDEIQKGIVSRDDDNRRANRLAQAELAHDSPEKAEKLKGTHKLYMRRSVAPKYYYKGKVITEFEKEQREIDYFWGKDDSSEEEGDVGLHGDEPAFISRDGDEIGDMDEDEISEEGGTQSTERFDANRHADFNTLTLPYRLHPEMVGSVPDVE
ncbi:MAG: hypothetical protein Q9168_008045 [Polycauliona sp. 1 TL-2023]